MKVILRKLIQDFRHAKAKLLLLVIAASLSGWGISGVVYSYFMTERDFEENFKKTFPADMALVIDNYQQGLEEKLLEDPAVVDIERREMISARIRSSRDSWMPVIIHAVDDLDRMRYDKINILEEEDRQPGKVLIEKNAFFFLQEDQEKIELLFRENGDIVTWQLDGKIHDARQAPARMEGLVYAYTTSIDVVEPFLKEGQRRLLIKTNVSSDKERLKEVGERLKNLCAQHEAKVVGVNIPNPGEHIHQGIVDGIEFLQRSGGLILAMMGIILLSLILLTWIFPQITDIGVMKAIGASTSNIFMSYITVLAGIIFSGMLIGLPLGYQTAFMYNRAVAFFQNFEVVTTLLPPPVHVLVVLICLIIPMLFGIIPLFKSAKTSVNEALNKIFYFPHKGIFRISQQLISSTRLKYGLNNLFRQSQRTFLTMLLLAVGLALYFTASNVDHSIRTDLERFAGTSPYEITVALPEKMKRADVAFLDQLPLVEQICPWSSSRATYVPPQQGNAEFTLIRTLSTEFDIEASLVLAGSIDKTCTTCIYVSGVEMRKRFESVDLGTPITFTSVTGEEITYRFSGILQDLIVVGAPFIAFNEKAGSTFNGLAFVLEAGLSDQEVLKVSNEIDDLFIENEINVLALGSIARRMAGIIGHLDPTFLVIKVTGIFTIVLGLFGLMIVLNLTIQERTREIGIMKSIGSPFGKISWMFKQEFALLSLIALVFGVLIAIPVATALIDIIAETIIRHPVAFLNDFYIIGLVVVVIIAVQTILISVYNRRKIGKNARELLDHHF